MDNTSEHGDEYEDYLKKIIGLDAYERGFSVQSFSQRNLRAPRELTERLLAATLQLVFPLTLEALKQKPIMPRKIVTAITLDFAANSAVAVMVTHNYPEEGIKAKTVINSLSQIYNLAFPPRR